MPHDAPPPWDRRTVLRTAGLAAGALLVGACQPTDQADQTAATPGSAAGSGPSPAEAVSPAGAASPPPPDAPGPPAPAPAAFDDLPTCQLTPAALEGPFPNREPLPRRDLTEGRPGHPLLLGLRVLDAGCAPVPGAEVAVWHTDHTGDYSSYADGGLGKDEAEGTTFMRGVQTSDADGIVSFRTVFPGWYQGRAVHIHVSVRTPDDVRLTTQLYFDETVTARILSDGVYAELGLPDTSLATDFLAGDPAADGTMLAVSDTVLDGQPGSLALLNLGVA